jgi:S1-C subfamily serine protease
MNTEKGIMSWSHLYCHVKDACVSIECVNTDRTENKMTSGFIIKLRGCYYIVTSCFTVLKNPPTITNAQTGKQNYNIWEEMYALISGINNTLQSRYYRLKLLAIDGRGDMALLQIHDDVVLLQLCNHDHLKFSKKPTKTGESIALIGYNDRSDHASITTGVVRDSKYLRADNTDPMQYVAHDIRANTYLSGAPIFNLCGEVIAMHSSTFPVEDDSTDTQSLAVKAFALRRFINSYFNNPGHFSTTHEDGIPLMSSFGSYKRYLKGFMGIKLDIFGSYSDLLRYLPVGSGWGNRNVNGGVVTDVGPTGGWSNSGLPDPPVVLLRINCKDIGTIDNNDHSVQDILWTKLPGEVVKIEHVSVPGFFAGTSSTTSDLTLSDYRTEDDLPFNLYSG